MQYKKVIWLNKDQVLYKACILHPQLRIELI